MSKKLIIEDSSWAHDYTIGGIRKGYHDEEKKKLYREGSVSTPYGYVECFSTAHLDSEPFSDFRIIYNGREYSRRLNRVYTSIGLARKATQFACEIVVGKTVDTADMKLKRGDYGYEKQKS